MKRRATRARGAASHDGRASSGDDSRGMPLEAAASSSLLPSSDHSADIQPSRSRKRRRDAGVDANHDNGGGNGGLEGGTSEAGATLFSAVMRRSGKASPPKPASKGTQPNAAMGTPQPKSQPSGKRMPRSPFSPGGYGLLRALDHANMSLYQEKRPDDDDGEAAEEMEIEPAWYDAAVHFKKGNDKNNSDDNWGGRLRRSNDLTEVLRAEKLNEGSGSGDDPIRASIVEATRHGVDFDHDDDDDAQPSATANGPDCPEPCGVGIMDWSLKNRMRVQCIPGRCLPGQDSLSLSQDADEGTVHRLALHYLSNGGSGVDGDDIGRECHKRGNATAEEVAMAKWTAGTMYHQHPAVHPLPSSMLQESSSNPGGSIDDLHNGGRSSSWKGRTNLSSCLRRVRLAGAGSMGGLGTSLPLETRADEPAGGTRRHQRPLLATASSLWDQRKREWQEAFRSMHAAWRARLRDLGGRSAPVPSPDELARCSFYAILPHRVVLFRAGHCDNEKDGDGGVVPMVVLSSTSARLRSTLAAMGVQLKLLTEIERGGATHTYFSERLLDNADEGQPRPGRATNDGDAAVHAELDAIKWADDEKGTVSVNLKKRGPNAKGGSGGGADVPPLYVAGRDDCGVVYELLLNTYGFAMDGDAEQLRTSNVLAAMPPADVPLLLCRSLGPCKHTSLRTLTVSRRRDGAHLRQGQDDGDDRTPRQASSDMASLELRGPILPCALRDLVCATVYRAMLDRRRTDRSDASRSRPWVDQLHDDGEGNASAAASSHQFIAFLQAHEGECPVGAPTSTGSSSSLRFNGSHATMVPKGDASGGWNECSPGDSVHALVWDASREAVVSFNPASAKMA